MQITNFRLIFIQCSEGKIGNDFSYKLLHEVQMNRLEGTILVGIEFHVEIEGKRFEVVQCEDEHLIHYIPAGAKCQDDFILVFQHNAYDEKYDILNHYLSFSSCELLSNLWLYRINNEYLFKKGV